MCRAVVCTLFVVSNVLVGCGDDASYRLYQATGTVIDYATLEPIDGVATIATEGVAPQPEIEVVGAEFSVSKIPPSSVFDIRAGGPGYIDTYNAGITIEESDLTNLTMFVVPDDYPKQLETGFFLPGDISTGETGLFSGRFVDDQGEPVAGVERTVFDVPPTIKGPFFFDAERNPDPTLTESSASGLFVLFAVPIGIFRLETVAGAEIAINMPDVLITTTTVTVTDVVVMPASNETTVNVSFRDQVVDIFANRNCILCHDRDRAGKDLGGLFLNSEPKDIYTELTQEVSQKHGVVRVNLESPSLSLLLTQPSREEPPDSHPTVTFASPGDPDYQTILKWIEDGALNN